MHHLTVQELLRDGTTKETQIIGKDPIVLQANPESLYSIIEDLGKKVEGDIEVLRVGHNLVVKIDGQLVLKIVDFYSPGASSGFNAHSLGLEAQLLSTNEPDLSDGVVWQSSITETKSSNIADLVPDVGSVEVGGEGRRFRYRCAGTGWPRRWRL